jgi:hypothetical protein
MNSNMQRGRFGGIGLVAGIILCVAFICSAQVVRGRPFVNGIAGAGANGMVNLPYLMNDNNGNNWRIYQGGWFQQNNNMPLYSQGGMLMINGQQVVHNNNQARLDPKTGELLLENLNANGCSITRRILIEKAGGYLRYIDVIKNTQAQPQTFNVMIQSNSNYGINTAQNVADPKKKDQNMGWVGMTGANQSIVEMFAGKGSKLAPQINWPQGNSFVQGTMAIPIPAGKEVAVMHLHTIAPTQDAGMKFITELKESVLMKTIAPALRRLIVNFRAGQSFIGDIEILRGDLLDVVELRSGDEFKGTLKAPNYELATFYGNVTLPVDKVIGLINVGQFRPRQLVITTDGQIFGGHLKHDTLELQMSSGQVTQIPLSQVARVGYRKRPDEPQEWTFDKPLVLMRSGERVAVQMPKTPIEVVTRYGKLVLGPEQVAAVVFQSEDNHVHEIQLADGSHFAGLLTADAFEMQLDTGGAAQVVKFPTSAIARIQLTNKVKESDDATPTIHLSNEDELNGVLVGKLKLDTSFDTIDVNAPELKSLTHAAEGGANDVQAVLWDGTSLSGQLEDQDVSCQLVGGVTLKVPVALVQDYQQPQPQPSASMVEQIKKVVETDLTNEDWHVRDRARAQLMSMGPAVAAVLKQVRDQQPPEAQKTIDIILAELEKQRKSGKVGATTAGAGVAQPQIIVDN